MRLSVAAYNFVIAVAISKTHNKEVSKRLILGTLYTSACFKLQPSLLTAAKLQS